MAPPPTPPPPEPIPPKFPVISQEECDLFQEGFEVDPPAHCTHVVLANNIDGCNCNMVLPGNINPQPMNLYNPFIIEVPPNPNVPVPPSMPTVPPPSNPAMPYNPPMMPPECPFQKACADADDFKCVGFNSWGFGQAGLADYSPAAAALNTASCMYTMKPYGEFKVPKKMEALWHLNTKLVKVFNRLEKEFTLYCDEENVTISSHTTWCREQVVKYKMPCTDTWQVVMKKSEVKACRLAPPPDGFDEESKLAELCPLECGWKKGEARWPPYHTSEEKEAKAKEEAEKAKLEGDGK